MSRRLVLPVIVLSQFACTSIWFASNAIMDDLIANFGFDESALGHLTSAVQFGFIAGTLVFAILSLADRYAPSKVFFVSALVATAFNLGVIWSEHSLSSIIMLRFGSGFFLAGIYPVGMKIAADYYEKGLGKSLGFLVGALVLGTAFPHLLKTIGANIPWRYIFMMTSGLSALGGLLMLALVPDGPYRKSSQRPKVSACIDVFRKKNFRTAAFGYFGHMWELYTFWAFVPVMLLTFNQLHGGSLNISLWSFIIIGIGSIACVVSGQLSSRLGTQRVAKGALFLSCMCCLLSPVIFTLDSSLLFVGFLLFWGMVVIADSPLFSTLVAQSADPEIKGTALTIVNCIGFAITIASIQLLSYVTSISDSSLSFMLLAIGPVLGLISSRFKRIDTDG